MQQANRGQDCKGHGSQSSRFAGLTLKMSTNFVRLSVRMASISGGALEVETGPDMQAGNGSFDSDVRLRRL